MQKSIQSHEKLNCKTILFLERTHEGFYFCKGKSGKQYAHPSMEMYNMRSKGNMVHKII